jgi:hypothetical protein
MATVVWIPFFVALGLWVGDDLLTSMLKTLEDYVGMLA